jgi:hypothetical protein
MCRLQCEYYLVGNCQKLVAKMICRSLGGRNNDNNNNDDNSLASTGFCQQRQQQERKRQERQPQFLEQCQQHRRLVTSLDLVCRLGYYPLSGALGAR